MEEFKAVAAFQTINDTQQLLGWCIVIEHGLLELQDVIQIVLKVNCSHPKHRRVVNSANELAIREEHKLDVVGKLDTLLLAILKTRGLLRLDHSDKCTTRRRRRWMRTWGWNRGRWLRWERWVRAWEWWVR